MRGTYHGSRFFVAEIIESVSGGNQHESDRSERYAGWNILALMPSAPYVYGQQRAQHDQHEHRGPAVQAQTPDLERMRPVAELPVHLQEVVEHQP